MAIYVTYQKNEHSNEPRLGIKLKEERFIVDVVEAEQYLYTHDVLDNQGSVPQDMINLIKLKSKVEPIITTIIEHASNNYSAPYIYEEEDVNLLAPIPRPKKNIFAVGLNYKEHNKEFTGKDTTSKYPIIFTKSPTSVIGTDAVIESFPKYTNSLDYEAELGVIIGKQGRDIPKEKAYEYIFGYTIINDISARDRQKRTSQWFLGKAMDTHAPMGPYIVESSEIQRPVKLDLICRVNGEIRQKSNTESLLFDIPTLISTLSEGITLEPGDIIATGTCEGVGMGFNPPKFLKQGDKVEIEIENLGILRNTVI